MEPATTWLYGAILLLIALICVIGALHPRYEDTLLQHVGMGVTTCGAGSEAYLILTGAAPTHGPVLFAVGVALFAVGTLVKKLPTPERLRRYKKL